MCLKKSHLRVWCGLDSDFYVYSDTMWKCPATELNVTVLLMLREHLTSIFFFCNIFLYENIPLKKIHILTTWNVCKIKTHVLKHMAFHTLWNTCLNKWLYMYVYVVFTPEAWWSGLVVSFHWFLPSQELQKWSNTEHVCIELRGLFIPRCPRVPERVPERPHHMKEQQKSKKKILTTLSNFCVISKSFLFFSYVCSQCRERL